MHEVICTMRNLPSQTKRRNGRALWILTGRAGGLTWQLEYYPPLYFRDGLGEGRDSDIILGLEGRANTFLAPQS